MADSEIFKLITCCTARDNNKHFVENPLQLDCGHYMCKDCKSDVLEETTIKCRICNKINKKQLNQNDISDIDFLIQQNIQELMQIINQKFHVVVSEIKELVMNENEIFKAKIEYIKEEIDIKVESLKINLEELRENLYDELDQISTNVDTQRVNKKNNKRINIKALEDDLKLMDDDIKQNSNFVSKSLYTYQNKLKKAKVIANELSYNQSDVKLRISDVKLDASIIGKIVLRNIFDFDSANLLKKIKNKQYNLVNTYGFSDDLCVLPNGYLTQSVWNYLRLYDKEFKLIRTIEKIHDFTISPVGLTHNGVDEIYIADKLNKKIIKTDLDFNLLAVSCRSTSNSTEPLEYPCGICYYKKLIYACDFGNERIHVLNSDDLNFEETYHFAYPVWFIKIINDTACVRENMSLAIYFYKVPGFFPVHKYKGHSGIIGVVNEHFFEYDNSKKFFYCYNKDGCLTETIDYIDAELEIGKSARGSIVWFDSKLLIGSGNSSQLISF